MTTRRPVPALGAGRVVRALACVLLGVCWLGPLAAQPGPDFDEPLVARGELTPALAALLAPVPLTGLVERLYPGLAPLPDGRMGWAQLPAPVGGVAGESPAMLLLRLQPEPEARARAALLAAASEEVLAQVVSIAPLDRPRHPDIVPGDSARAVMVLDGLFGELVERRGLATYDPRLGSFEARLRLADWLRRRGERRCVGLYEELLAEWGLRAGWCEPLYRLGLWYSEQGDVEEAVATWSRGDQYSTDHGAHFLIYAANEFRRSAPEQAAALYAQAYEASAAHGDGWSMALALRGRAYARQRVGDLSGALAILSEPVAGVRAGEGAAALAIQRASLLFDAGEYAAAAQAASAAETLLAAVTEPLAGDGFESLLPTAQRCATWAARWAAASAWSATTSLVLEPTASGGWVGTMTVSLPAGAVPRWVTPAGLTVTEERDQRGTINRFYREYVLRVEAGAPLAQPVEVQVWSGAADEPQASLTMFISSAAAGESNNEVP